MLPAKSRMSTYCCNNCRLTEWCWFEILRSKIEKQGFPKASNLWQLYLANNLYQLIFCCFSLLFSILVNPQRKDFHFCQFWKGRHLTKIVWRMLVLISDCTSYNRMGSMQDRNCEPDEQVLVVLVKFWFKTLKFNCRENLLC